MSKSIALTTMAALAIGAATQSVQAATIFTDTVEAVGDYTLVTGGSLANHTRASGDQGLTAQAGANFVSVSGDATGAYSGTVTLTAGFAGQTVQAGTYTASISLGKSGEDLSRPSFDTFTLKLQTTGGTEIGTPTITDPYVQPGAVDAWDVLTVQYTVASGSALIGQDLTWSGDFAFAQLAAGTFQYGAFDNVEVQYVPVPEPGSLALLGLGGLLIARRRRS